MSIHLCVYIDLGLCHRCIYILIIIPVGLSHMKLTVLGQFCSIKMALTNALALYLYLIYIYISLSQHQNTQTPPVLNLGVQGSGCSGMERKQGLGDLGVKEVQGWLPSCPGLRESWSPPLPLLTGEEALINWPLSPPQQKGVIDNTCATDLC